ncbi:MAG: sugar porter family MFS transporter [Muribaculaceae bacterium]|nr:sugar porter family MFS transporter [Muribaculaceae bacterium]
MFQINRKFIYFICCVSAMGGLLFGYDWVVIGGAKPFYETYFGIADNPSMQGLAMSIAIAGCLAGAMVAGFFADRFGRKPLLIFSAIVFLASAYMTGAVDTFVPFLWARLIGGVAIGVASGLSPMYIAEVSPPDTRGRMVSINQLTIVLGILVAQIVNWLIAEPIPAGMNTPLLESWNCQHGWRWMFWAEGYPAAIFLVLVMCIPESPRWLMMKGEGRKATDIFRRIGGGAYAEAEINAIRESGKGRGDAGTLAMLFRSPYLSLIILGIVIAVFQQWCGTNVIFNYAQEIFSNAGYDLGDMLFNIVLTGVTNVVFTFVALYAVDKIGRKKLMLMGSGGLFAIYLTLGGCYYLQVAGFMMVILVMGAIACYAMTLGPVTWVLLSEIFPNRVRGMAMAVCTFALWTGCFTLTYSFPLLNSRLGSYGTFWLYSMICLAGFLYFRSRLTETKGKTLEQIEKDYDNVFHNKNRYEGKSLERESGDTHI